MKRYTLSFPLLAMCLCLIGMAGCQGESASSDGNQAPDVTADHDSPEHDVVDVVNDLFQAMEARDSIRIQMALHPNALFTSVDLTGDEPTTKRTEGSAFASSVGQPGIPYVEKMVDPVVKYHGDFAHLWAYYEFYLGDSLSHCGHDSFQLVRLNEQWRILGITYTRTTCP